MPRGRKINNDLTLDDRVKNEFATMHRKTLEKHVNALVLPDPRAMEKLTIIAVSLAPTREAAEGDFAQIMGTYEADGGFVIKVPFWFASGNLNDVPVIVASGVTGVTYV